MSRNKASHLTKASVIKNPLDVEMKRFIAVSRRGTPGIIEVVISPGDKVKIRELLHALNIRLAQEGIDEGPFRFKGVCPPGMTEEDLQSIAAAFDAIMVPFPLPNPSAHEGNSRAAQA